jgi:uncharacterized membrane protein
MKGIDAGKSRHGSAPSVTAIEPLPCSTICYPGSVLYLTGSTVVTMVCNVPLNNVLAAADPGSAEGDRIWTRYLEVWTMWNHVRTVACLATTALLTLGFCARA